MADTTAARSRTTAVERVTDVRPTTTCTRCARRPTPRSSTAAASAGSIRPAGARWRRYFRGVLLVPERELFVARLDGVIVGSAQLVRPPRNNEAQAFAATLMHSFIAPYARGHGLARLLTERRRGAARARSATRC